jgi:hypothetical protein
MNPTNKLDKVLTRLVSETNEYVLNSQPRDVQPKSRRPVTSQPRKVNSRPEWAEEFNRETSETDKPAASKVTREEAVVTKPGTLAVPAKKRRKFFGLFGKR